MHNFNESHPWEALHRLVRQAPGEAPKPAVVAPATAPPDPAEVAAKEAARKEAIARVKEAGAATTASEQAAADQIAQQLAATTTTAAPETPANPETAPTAPTTSPPAPGSTETATGTAVATGVIGGEAALSLETGAAAVEGKSTWERLVDQIEKLIDLLSKKLDGFFGGKEKKDERTTFGRSPIANDGKIFVKENYNNTRGTMIVSAAPGSEVHAVEDGKITALDRSTGLLVIERAGGEKITYRGIQIDPAMAINTEIKTPTTRLGTTSPSTNGVFEIGFTKKDGSTDDPVSLLAPYITTTAPATPPTTPTADVSAATTPPSGAVAPTATAALAGTVAPAGALIIGAPAALTGVATLAVAGAKPAGTPPDVLPSAATKPAETQRSAPKPPAVPPPAVAPTASPVVPTGPGPQPAP